jgi:teichuronic acid biosynthesis glycosyltransferase TuaG
VNKISVIVPTWNRATLLAEAVRSTLAQTTPPLEVLVCDDGSTDESERAMREICDPRVKWLPGERAGRPAVPRNRGIRVSRGEWLAFLDNDDAWFPEKLERQLRAAERTGCRAICGNAVRFVPGMGDAGNYFGQAPELVSFNDLLTVNRVICSSSLIHRSLIGQVEGFPEVPELRALEDYSLWLRIAAFTDFAYLSEPLLRYRDEASTSVRSGDFDLWEQRRRVFEDFLSWGERMSIGPEFLWKVRNRLLRDKGAKLAEKMVKPAKKMKKALLG